MSSILTTLPIQKGNMELGCGNPQSIAELKERETVLDLGRGGGFGCFLASTKVGATGKVIGVDMTPELTMKLVGVCKLTATWFGGNAEVSL